MGRVCVCERRYLVCTTSQELPVQVLGVAVEGLGRALSHQGEPRWF